MRATVLYARKPDNSPFCVVISALRTIAIEDHRNKDVRLTSSSHFAMADANIATIIAIAPEEKSVTLVLISCICNILGLSSLLSAMNFVAVYPSPNEEKIAMDNSVPFINPYSPYA